MTVNGYENQLNAFFNQSNIKSGSAKKSGSQDTFDISSSKDIKALAEHLAKPGNQSVTVNVGKYTFILREIGSDPSNKKLSVVAKQEGGILGSDDRFHGINIKNSLDFGISRESFYTTQLETQKFDKSNLQNSQQSSQVSAKNIDENSFTVNTNGSYKYQYSVQGTGKVSHNPIEKKVNIGIIFDNSLSITDGSSEETNMINNLANHIKGDLPLGSKVTLTGVCTPEQSQTFTLIQNPLSGQTELQGQNGEFVSVHEALKNMRTGNTEARQTTPLYKSIAYTSTAVGQGGSLEIWTDFSGSDIDKDLTANPEEEAIQQNAFNSIKENNIKTNAFIIGTNTSTSQFETSNDNNSGAISFHNLENYDQISALDYTEFYAPESIDITDISFGYKVNVAPNEKGTTQISSIAFNQSSLPIKAATTQNVNTSAQIEGSVVFDGNNYSFKNLTIDGKKIIPGHNFNFDQIALQAQKGQGKKSIKEIRTAMLIDQSNSMNGGNKSTALKSAVSTFAQSNMIHITSLAGLDDNKDAPIYFTDNSPEFNNELEKEIIAEATKITGNHRENFVGTPLFQSTSSYINQLNDAGNNFNEADQIDIVTDGLPVNDVYNSNRNFDNGLFNNFRNSVQTAKQNNKKLNFVVIANLTTADEIIGNNGKQAMFTEQELNNLSKDLYNSKKNGEDIVKEMFASKGMNNPGNLRVSTLMMILAAKHTGGELIYGTDATQKYTSKFALSSDKIDVENPNDKVTHVKVSGSFPDDPGTLYEFTIPVTKQ